MKRLITCTAVALALGLTPALAADANSSAQSDQNRPPTGQNVSSSATKAATQPANGSADTSSGAMQQSSAPPNSGATGAPNYTASSAYKPKSGTPDTSGGATEQSSAPPSSAAANPAAVNPNNTDPATGDQD
jgi:hypothetical protein